MKKLGHDEITSKLAVPSAGITTAMQSIDLSTAVLSTARCVSSTSSRKWRMPANAANQPGAYPRSAGP